MNNDIKNTLEWLNISENAAKALQDFLQEYSSRDASGTVPGLAKHLEDLTLGLNPPKDSFILCIVITGISEKLFCPAAEHRLSQIFPTSAMGCFENRRTVLYCQKHRPTTKIDIDYEAFGQFLTDIQGHAAISNATRQENRIMTLYKLAETTLRLGLIFDSSKDRQRIYHYEDFSMYHLVDLSARQFIREYGHDDLIYLVHPAIIQIARYDQKHRSGLLDVLFSYLVHDRNVAATAKALYMHRNTVLNKINRIEEITGLNLSDGYMQHRLTMSCLIIKYYEAYMKKQIRL